MNFWEWLIKLFEAIFKPKKPDMEIKVCLDNPTSTPIQARDDCPHWETRKYVEGTVLAVCEMDHNEYVKRIICLDNLPGLKLKNPYCKRTEERRFIKGQEPSEVCKIHKKPDPPIVYPSFKKYSIHLIDVFAYTYNHPSWDIHPLIERVAKTGASAIHAFGWAGYPGQKYDIEAIPWEWVDIWVDKNRNEVSEEDVDKMDETVKALRGIERIHVVDFNQKNPKYEATFKKIAKACFDQGIDYRHILFMSRYNFHIFRHNLNRQRIREFYSPEGLVVQKEYTLDCLRWNNEVGIKEPTVLLMNEPGHYGDDDMGHTIAVWSREIGDLCALHTPIENVWTDTSHSEYPRAYFVGPHECPKSHEVPFMFGRKKYAHRPMITEVHNSSTLQGLMDNNPEAFYGSANRVWAVNEDGSAYGSTIAYNPNGSIAFRFANAEEYRELLEYVKRKDEESSKNAYIAKDTYVVGFPTGMLNKGEGDFSDLNKIDWEKYDLYKEIFGGSA